MFYREFTRSLQKEFKSKYMRKRVDYSEHVRSIAQEIDYADGQIED